MKYLGRVTAFTLVMMGVAGIVSLAQARPDFSGQWAADVGSVAPAGAAPLGGATAPPSIRGDMGSGWGPAITIKQDAKQLVVEYVLFSRYDLQPPLQLVYAPDGSETISDVMIGHTTQERRSRAVWKDQTLEITTIYPSIHPASGKPFTTEVVQRLRLESPDALVIDVTRRAPGAEPSSTRTIYKRSSLK